VILIYFSDFLEKEGRKKFLDADSEILSTSNHHQDIPLHHEDFVQPIY
jgi:hypothetical protein